jgi:predicted ABC-type ATPase
MPCIVLLAGPNGAGKSTAAPLLLRDALGITEFVNADVIAHGLSAFNAEGVSLAAGRLMIKRLHELAEKRKDFAFETTLASKSFIPWITQLLLTGYGFNLIYLWLPSAETAVQRVRDRKSRGGHFVDEETVRRRYEAGLRNFASYQALATDWWVYVSVSKKPRLVARGSFQAVKEVVDPVEWSIIKERLLP